MKKILLSLGAVTAVLVGASMFAAFEAHVVNVTARIENALFVPMAQSGIDFGTVFPQEKLDKFFDVSLSQSFQDEDRVDDVTYVIRQKPKCQLAVTNGTELPEFGVVTEDTNGNFVCLDDEHYDILPLLCPYLSKHETTTDGQGPTGAPLENDSAGIAAFHGLPGPWTMNTTLATQVAGKLIKSAGDILDTWNIDLKVPCFGNHCAQDWADFVADNDGNNNADPELYIQPIENEHKLFGCDLWLEVTGISLPGLGCTEDIDLMLVLDRSGSLDNTELDLLQTAAKSFVDALAPTTDGVHIGEASFSTTGSLDQALTDNGVLVKAAIDNLDALERAFTNLFEGLDYANTELAGANDRNDATVPDVMVVITDGNPNQPTDEVVGRAAALAEATAAKAAGVEIFVVGVGDNVDDVYLKTIATNNAHYYAAADYASLQAVLQQLTQCE